MLEVFHRAGRFGGDGLDYLQHFRGGFAEIWVAFPGKNFAVARAPGTFSALGNVDRHVPEQAELHQPRARVAINNRVAVHLNVHPRFVFRFSRRRAGSLAWSWRYEG